MLTNGVCMSQEIRLKILWNFEIKIDHQIPTRRPSLVLINKKKKKKKKKKPKLVSLWILLSQQLEIVIKKATKLTCQSAEKVVEYVGDNSTDQGWDTWNSS